MAAPRNDEAHDQVGEVGKANSTSSEFCGNTSPPVKATVHQLPGAHRRRVVRCDACGGVITDEGNLCSVCSSGLALVARITARRAESLRLQALGQQVREAI